MVTELLAGALVVVTTFYAWATFQILRANERVVAVMQDQAEGLTRPYVTVSVLTPPRSIVLYLRVANTGRTSAQNVRLALDRDFFRYGGKDPGDNLRTFSAFQEEIQCLPPGGELVFALAQGFVIFGPEADPARTPTVFRVTASYGYGDKRVTETTPIDLRPYLRSDTAPDPLVDELRRIKETLDKLESAVERQT